MTLPGGYVGLLMGYSVLGVTKLINPVIKLTASFYAFIIMQDKKVTLKKFHGQVLVDIREFYMDKLSREMMPGWENWFY